MFHPLLYQVPTSCLSKRFFHTEKVKVEIILKGICMEERIVNENKKEYVIQYS